MRAVFINYSHPDTPHISGMRVSRFAIEMANRGHQIVLLTRTKDDECSSSSPEDLASALELHDWRQPFYLACAPRPEPQLERLRAGLYAPCQSKMIVLREYLMHGGMFHDWVAGTRPYWKPLVSAFKPEVVWGTFGNTDTLWIGREIARLAGAAWCVDIKDNWDRFVPKPFRGMLGRRVRQADAVTANSAFHGNIARKWMGLPFETIYSGYEGLEDENEITPWGDIRALFIGGSLYVEDGFRLLLESVSLWWSEASSHARSFLFVYAGADHVRAAKLLATVPFPFEVMPFLPSFEYARRCRYAWVNVYIWSPKTFHHKAVELLATGRPILAVGGEHEETQCLAAKVGGIINICRQADEICEFIKTLWNGDSEEVPVSHVPPRMMLLSWLSQAVVLERTLVGSQKKVNACLRQQRNEISR